MRQEGVEKQARRCPLPNSAAVQGKLAGVGSNPTPAFLSRRRIPFFNTHRQPAFGGTGVVV